RHTRFSRDWSSDVCSSDLSASLKEDGMWLVGDFVTSRIWHRAMIWAMYRFFRVMCGISTVQLPNWEECIKRAGFISRDSDFFYRSEERRVGKGSCAPCRPE